MGQWANLFSRPQRASGHAIIGIETRPPSRKNHKSHSQVCQGHLCPCQLFPKTAKPTTQDPHMTKNRKAAHTRSTQDPQRPKTRKAACRAGLMNIRHARSTRSTRSTWACGSSYACGYLGGYSLYFYIILYIYKSECECECE